MSQVFSKFGKILRLEVLKERDTVLVFMEKFKDAFNALKFMHMRQLQVENQVDNLKCNFLKENELHLIPGPEVLEEEDEVITDNYAFQSEPIYGATRKSSGISDSGFQIRDTTQVNVSLGCDDSEYSKSSSAN